MVKYNPKDWFGLIFKFHKSDTFRKLLWVMVSIAIYAGLVVYISEEVLQLEPRSVTVMHSLLGFVISLLLVFRTNTAYDRWWEGRKQWGALVNVSRNLALKMQAFIPTEDVELRTRMFHSIWAYADVLRGHLRDNVDDEEVFSRIPDTLKVDKERKHIPNIIAENMQHDTLTAFKKHELSQASYLAMLEDVNAFTDICGACERIKKTPIPYNYNIFIKKFIFVYIVSMPLAFVGDFHYWTILATLFTFYTLASLELIAETIEDPFGIDPDDLPTDDLAITIRKNVEEIKSSKHGI
jgi:ion channel-forming bestrophin family protein